MAESCKSKPYPEEMRRMVGKITDLAQRLERVMHLPSDYVNVSGILDGIDSVTNIAWYASIDSVDDEDFRKRLGAMMQQYDVARESLEYAEAVDMRMRKMPPSKIVTKEPALTSWDVQEALA